MLLSKVYRGKGAKGPDNAEKEKNKKVSSKEEGITDTHKSSSVEATKLTTAAKRDSGTAFINNDPEPNTNHSTNHNSSSSNHNTNHNNSSSSKRRCTQNLSNSKFIQSPNPQEPTGSEKTPTSSNNDNNVCLKGSLRGFNFSFVSEYDLDLLFPQVIVVK